MKAITLRQPYAGLMALGYKTIDTRRVPTTYTGDILIHASKVTDEDAMDKLETFREQNPSFSFDETVLQSGVLLAKGRLKKCVRQEEIDFPYSPNTDPYIKMLVDIELTFGTWDNAHYAWCFVDMVRLPHVIPTLGGLGIWDYTGVL